MNADKTKAALEIVESFNDKLALFQSMLRDYFNDRSVPLSERWQVFVQTPNELKVSEHFFILTI